MRDRANQRVPRSVLPGTRVNSDPGGTPANREAGGCFCLRFAYNFFAGPDLEIEVHDERCALAASICESSSGIIGWDARSVCDAVVVRAAGSCC